MREKEVCCISPPTRGEVVAFVVAFVVASVLTYGFMALWTVLFILFAKKRREWSITKVMTVAWAVATILYIIIVNLYYLFF